MPKAKTTSDDFPTVGIIATAKRDTKVHIKFRGLPLNTYDLKRGEKLAILRTAKGEE